MGIGWLAPSHVEEWRQGRVEYLERVAQANLAKLSAVMKLFRTWATSRGLVPSETVYVAAHPRSPASPVLQDRQPRHRACLPDALGLAHAVRSEAPPVGGAPSRPADLVVVSSVKDWTCAECSGTGDLLIMEGPGPLCLACADRDHLVYLPSRNATLTRRAKKASGLSAVVVRFSRTRRRYERQGILVEEAALDQAERECLADEDARARRREHEEARRAEQDAAFAGGDGGRDRPTVPRLPRPRAKARRPPGRRPGKRAGRA